jgi:hypothetical protein
MNKGVRFHIQLYCVVQQIFVDVWVLDVTRVITSVSCVLDVYSFLFVLGKTQMSFFYPKSFQTVWSKTLPKILNFIRLFD